MAAGNGWSKEFHDALAQAIAAGQPDAESVEQQGGPALDGLAAQAAEALRERLLTAVRGASPEDALKSRVTFGPVPVSDAVARALLARTKGREHSLVYLYSLAGEQQHLRGRRLAFWTKLADLERTITFELSFD